MKPPDASLLARIARAGRLRLFLDYDGTLADLAPTPDYIETDSELVDLLSRLVAQPSIRAAVISGRRLAHVRQLVPVPGLLLAGTYGVELLTPEGERIDRIDHDAIRPVLERIKPRWAELIAGRQGFFLEDKDWALALHARYAGDEEADQVLGHARRLAQEVVAGAPDGLFRVLGGHKFLEIGPQLAHKGRTVAYLLERWPWPGALPLYIGDDDKDEEAFAVIQARGGIALVVMSRPHPSQADLALASPQATRRWLNELLSRLA